MILEALFGGVRALMMRPLVSQRWQEDDAPKNTAQGWFWGGALRSNSRQAGNQLQLTKGISLES